MPRTLEPVPMDEAAGWSGHILPRQVVKHLSIDSIVRVIIRNTDKGAEAIYFKITKIKDGTF